MSDTVEQRPLERPVRRKRFHIMDFVILLMVAVPMTGLYTGLNNFLVSYFAASFFGYALYIRGVIRWKQWRWYADA